MVPNGVCFGELIVVGAMVVVVVGTGVVVVVVVGTGVVVVVVVGATVVVELVVGAIVVVVLGSGAMVVKAEVSDPLGPAVADNRLKTSTLGFMGADMIGDLDGLESSCNIIMCAQRAS